MQPELDYNKMLLGETLGRAPKDFVQHPVAGIPYRQAFSSPEGTFICWLETLRMNPTSLSTYPFRCQEHKGSGKRFLKHFSSSVMSGIPNADWTIKYSLSEVVPSGKMWSAHSFFSLTFSSPLIWAQCFATIVTENDLPQEMELWK